MARARKKRRSKTPESCSWGFLVLAYGFGLACMAAGVVILVFGTAHESSDAQVKQTDVVMTGVGMIALGLVAIGITVVIQRTKK